MSATLALPFARLRPGVSGLLRREAGLSMLGIKLLIAVPPTLFALALDQRTIGGVSVWLKPLKFQISISLHLLTLALALGALDPRVRRGRTARWAVATVLAAAVFEAVWITLRGAQGLPSHFAGDTLGQVMFALMGILATAMVAATAVLGALLLRAPDAGAEPLVARAAALGLLVAGIAGLVTGWAIALNGGPMVGGPVPMGSPSLPVLGWSGIAGDLRVAHFLGLHAAQGLPVLGLLLSAVPAARGRGVVSTVAILWSALTLAVMLQAIAGLPAIPLG